MSVYIETSAGDVVVDLFTDECPQTCQNFLKLCKYASCYFLPGSLTDTDEKKEHMHTSFERTRDILQLRQHAG